MTKDELINKLSGLPDEIYIAEIAIFEAQNKVAVAREHLAAKEANLYDQGVIDGKNAEIRSTQLKQLTTPERNEIAKAENALNLARMDYNRHQNNFAAYRAIAGLLKGAE